MIAFAPVSDITPEQLLSMPEGDRFELIDGQLVERDMGAESAWIGGEIHSRLRDFAKKHNAGWVLPPDASYQCFQDRPTRVRRPDVSLIRFGRLPGEQLPKGHIPITPDLVVEVVSPNDFIEAVEAKMAEFLAAGVPQGWLVLPNLRQLRIYTLDAIRRLTEHDELHGEGPVEGLRFPIRDIFPPPVKA